MRADRASAGWRSRTSAPRTTAGARPAAGRGAAPSPRRAARRSGSRGSTAAPPAGAARASSSGSVSSVGVAPPGSRSTSSTSVSRGQQPEQLVLDECDARPVARRDPRDPHTGAAVTWTDFIVRPTKSASGGGVCSISHVPICREISRSRGSAGSAARRTARARRSRSPPRHLLGEHDRVLDRHRAALPDVRRGRVRGVADQDDPSAVPRRRDEQRLHGSDDDLRRVGDVAVAHLGDGAAELRRAARGRSPRAGRRASSPSSGDGLDVEDVHQVRRERYEPAPCRSRPTNMSSVLEPLGARDVVAPHDLARVLRRGRVREDQAADAASGCRPRRRRGRTRRRAVRERRRSRPRRRGHGLAEPDVRARRA